MRVVKPRTERVTVVRVDTNSRPRPVQCCWKPKGSRDPAILARGSSSEKNQVTGSGGQVSAFGQSVVNERRDMSIGLATPRRQTHLWHNPCVRSQGGQVAPPLSQVRTALRLDGYLQLLAR